MGRGDTPVQFKSADQGRMSRTTVVVLIVPSVIAAVLAAPRMPGSAVGEFLRGRCDTPPQPRECFPAGP